MMNLVQTYDEIPDYYLQSDVFQRIYNSKDFKNSSIESLFESEFIPRKDIPIENYDDFLSLIIKLDYYSITDIKIITDYINNIKFDFDFWEEFENMPEETEDVKILKEKYIDIRLSLFEQIIDCRGYQSVILRKDASINFWGGDNDEIIDSNKFIAVACGVYHYLALDKNGKCLMWGRNNESQLTDIPDGRFIFITCGSYHSVAIHENGKIFCWGNNDKEQLVKFPNKDDKFVKVTCGEFHSVALSNNGKVFCWGSNEKNQLKGIPDFNPKNGKIFTSIACGSYHSVALRIDGKIFCWGNNKMNQLDGIDKLYSLDRIFVKISCGAYHSVGLDNNGKIIFWGNMDYNQFDDNPYQVTDIEIKNVDISCGAFHTVVLGSDGYVWSFGSNEKEQLKDTPTESSFIKIACGGYHSVAIKKDRSFKCWGFKNKY